MGGSGNWYRWNTQKMVEEAKECTGKTLSG